MISFANLLTLHTDIQTFAEYTVAPYVGAWIETEVARQTLVARLVAPYVGAWIETKKVMNVSRRSLSHPMWVRGLKRAWDHAQVYSEKSHPMWVRGLKRNTASNSGNV